jgi:hypothetical protein
MKVMKIPVAITRTAPEERDYPRVRVALRALGYTSILGSSAYFVVCLLFSLLSPLFGRGLGFDLAYEGFAVFVGGFVLGWLCFMNRYSGS